MTEHPTIMAEIPAEIAAEIPAAAEARWISLHVFYADDPSPLLVDCVRPLVEALSEQGLLRGYFFIRYWVEGPHIRLRLRPTDDAAREPVLELAKTRINAFLRRHPALPPVDHPGTAQLHRQLWIAEHGEQSWTDNFGPDGTMPIRPTNTLHEIEYEPEYKRYGGPAGVELAEWHFRYSSDLVLRLLGEMNLHLRPVLLGLSAQLSLTLCLGFLSEPGDPDPLAAAARFFGIYRSHWESTYAAAVDDAHTRYEQVLSRSGPELTKRLKAVSAAVSLDNKAALGPAAGAWLTHAYELRDRALDLLATGRLALAATSATVPTPARDMTRAQGLSRLLSSYLHMTNNRLGVTIPDEIYLSYLIEHAAGGGS